jgi:Flp pilus assembly protein TadB
MTATIKPPSAETDATDLADRSTADLVKLAAEQVSRLVRDELKLAQTELAEKGKRAGIGVGLFGTAGVVSLYGVGVLIAAAVLGLATALEPWIAALIVAVVLVLLAGLLALIGRGQVKKAVPPAPTEAVRNVKADIDTISGAVKDGRHR